MLTLPWAGDWDRVSPRSIPVSVIQWVYICAWWNDAWNHHLRCVLTCSFALWKCRHGLAGYSTYWWEVSKKKIVCSLQKKRHCQAFPSHTPPLLLSTHPPPIPPPKFQPLLQWLLIQAGVSPKGENEERTNLKYFLCVWNTDAFKPQTPPWTAPLSRGAMHA